ncbi:MAG: hypothetical protein JNM94_16005 [Phycisphaerae bacterium]|nr:hypothetical protein [Phycisphaerae bacterium]
MHSAAFAAVALATSLLGSTAALAQNRVTVTYTTPTGDRWNYPFNPTPGIRPTASVFGNEAGAAIFDNRDGQMTLIWNTNGDVPAGLPISAYFIKSARVTVEHASDLAIEYDNTTDPWQAFLPESDPNYVADPDPGQPIEIFGTGFRNGVTLATWQETTPFTVAGQSPLNPGVRSAYALGFNDVGEFVDVSNSVRDQVSPDPFATGFVEGLTPGEFIPIGSKCIFDLAIDNPLVQGYLQESLSAGRLSLSITSLAKVVQQGTVFPSFYCKESPLVAAGLAAPAKLELTVLVFTCAPADFDCDGSVGPTDLGILLGAWGTNSPQYDLNGDGTIDAADLGVLLGAWG